MADSEGSTGVVMGKMYASKVFETGLNVPWMYNLKPKNVRKYVDRTEDTSSK